MAESITEGTLKQWQKKVGQHVEQDEEVATIETDKVQSLLSFIAPTLLRQFLKIDVSVNAPQAGRVIELLVDEEATVTVGQDLFRIEPGAEGEGARKRCHVREDYSLLASHGEQVRI